MVADGSLWKHCCSGAVTIVEPPRASTHVRLI